MPLILFLVAWMQLFDAYPAARTTLRTSDQRRFEHITVGACRVTAPTAAGLDAPDDGNMFLIRTGKGRTIAINPDGRAPDFGTADRTKAVDVSQSSEVNLIILTRIDERTTKGLVTDGAWTFPNARVVADPWVLDHAASYLPPSANAILKASIPNTTMRAVLPNTEAAPGVMLRIVPGGSSPELGVEIDCGTETLVVWNGSLGSKSRRVESSDASMPADRLRFLKRHARDGHVLASTSGSFPTLGRIYELKDGFHWGTLQARGGGIVRRGTVTVEPSEDVGADDHPHQSERIAAQAFEMPHR